MIWIHQICWDTKILVTDALELAENKSLWRQITTTACYGRMLSTVFFNLFAAAEPCITVTITHGTPCNDL